MMEFIHHICQLDMFRTSTVHLQERFVQAVCADLVRAVIRVLLDTSSRSSYNFVAAERVE